MNPTITDTEYSSSARAALIAIARWLETPCALLSTQHQQQFIAMVADKVLPIVNSEPHLRGTMIESLIKAKEFDMESVRRERDSARLMATNLLASLKRQPLPRGIEHRKVREVLVARATEMGL